MKMNIDGLEFRFPENWLPKPSEYDKWVFYRKKIQNLCPLRCNTCQQCKSCDKSGLKAIDVLAISPDKTVFLIEVKDYRPRLIKGALTDRPQPKPSELSKTIQDKVFHTLAALLPAQLFAENEDERALAKEVLASQSFRVVLHLELAKERSLDAGETVLSIRQQLNRFFKAQNPLLNLDAMVVSMSAMQDIPWVVTDHKPLD